MDGETLVALLPDGTELLVKHWPAVSVAPEQRWHVAVRNPNDDLPVWGPPLEIVRVEGST